MHLKQIMKRTVAIALILTMLLGLCGCDALSAGNAAMDVMEAMGYTTAIEPGTRLENSAWINSDLEGAIDENTELNLKDDFHTTVNRDWLLETTSEGDETLSTWDIIISTMAENQYSLLYRDKELNPDPNVMSKETLTHVQELLWDMADLASDQEKRNELGLSPLIPYLEAIDSIDSMEEMTQYLINADKRNFTCEDLVNVFVNVPVKDRDTYTVYITFTNHMMLIAPEAYTTIGLDSYNLYNVQKASLEYILGEFGYTPREIRKILYNCYTFERAFSGLLPTSTEKKEETYKDRSNKIYTLEDLQKLQGKFPLTQILEAHGVANSETFRIFEPAYVHFLGTFYKQKNLETLKDYFLVQTILDSLPYLDEDWQYYAYEMKKIREGADLTPCPVMPEDTTDEAAMEAYRLDSLMYAYIDPLLKVPFQLAYIGNYFTSEAKQQIRDMVEDVRAYYIELLSNVEWLSPQTRDLAVEKMEKMAVRIMYPDVLPDYSNLSYLTYEEGGNLLDAVAAINQHNHTPDAEKVNKSVKRNDWDLQSMSTLVANAYNEHTSNGIVILGGILAGDFMYDPDAPIEENYGKLGVIVGHEVSHSFDTNGYGFDSEGRAYGWFTNDDEVALRQRSDKLASYYSKLMYLPGSTMPYVGTTIQGEAISDMGGMKCMLGLAEDIPDFDYDLFFRSFASMWVRQTSYNVESSQAHQDEHPLGFFRTNVTLQQFDKFFETYGIGPGDGMYLAPEDRILVW